MRTAARIDANQPAIVKALEAIGAKVVYIKKPLDLLVGFRKRNILLEVKNKEGFDRETKDQVAFIATWPGELHIVYTPEEAVAAVIGKEAMR